MPPAAPPSRTPAVAPKSWREAAYASWPAAVAQRHPGLRQPVPMMRMMAAEAKGSADAGRGGRTDGFGQRHGDFFALLSADDEMCRWRRDGPPAGDLQLHPALDGLVDLAARRLDRQAAGSTPVLAHAAIDAGPPHTLKMRPRPAFISPYHPRLLVGGPSPGRWSARPRRRCRGLLSLERQELGTFGGVAPISRSSRTKPPPIEK